MSAAAKLSVATSATLASLLITASGCGFGEDGGEAAAAASPRTSEGWIARADLFCTDGTQEATALPLPTRVAAIPADAAARAEIVATVRDGLVTLGRPDGIDAGDLSTFLAELDADLQLLAGAADGAPSSAVLIDESAGQVAGELGLPDCAAFVNAVARTP